jgi:short-subunit dehydrogenase
MSAEQVAREGYRGWSRGNALVIPGSANRRGTWVMRLAPRAMVRRIIKRLNSVPRDGR